MKSAVPLLLMSLIAAGIPAPAPAGTTRDLEQQLTSLLAASAVAQEEGRDISPIVPFLKGGRSYLRNGQRDRAAVVIEAGERVLAELPEAPPLPSGNAMLAVHAHKRSEAIPRLAGNVVLKDFLGNPRYERFMAEIGPGTVQIKLFLHDLDTARSNYAWSRFDGRWEETIREIHAAGGTAMLHIRNVPSRMSMDPSINLQPTDGKAPLATASSAEWKTVVEEVVGHFAADPDTRFDYLQTLGEPNIGTNWFDPELPADKRPLNARQFARFHRDTTEAALAADPNIRVGGPTVWFSSNDESWWTDFLGELAATGSPLHFASVHIYDANFGIWDRGVAMARAALAANGFEDVPVWMTEWNLNIDAGSLAKGLKESHINASHAVVGLVRVLDNEMGQTYFQLSAGEVAEALGLPGRLGVAGSNLLVMKKGVAVANTSYNALRLFSMLHDARRLAVDSNDPRVIAVAGRRRQDEVSVLLTYNEPLERKLDVSDPDLPYRKPKWGMTRNVDLTFDKLPFKRYTIETWSIDRDHANLHTLGSSGAELSAPETRLGFGKELRMSLEIPMYGVRLVRLLRTK